MTATQNATAAFSVTEEREEQDLLGSLAVPADAYYGIQTLRAINNFQLSDIPLSHYPKLIVALAMVKQAAASANHQLGHLENSRYNAIVQACQAIIAGQYHDQFVVDMIQGGAGTSTNMNANEVIANLGLEFLNQPRAINRTLTPTMMSIWARRTKTTNRRPFVPDCLLDLKLRRR